MINNILLKNLFLSTSSINILKTEKDKKKRSKIKSAIAGKIILFILLMFFCISVSIGYGYIGITAAIPVLCCLVISLMEFVFTIFKTNGYLFAFKDYDMLMSLPFSVKDVVSSKFLYMYIENLPWTISISIAMEIGYGLFAKPAFYIYIIWFVLSLFIPLIPMVLASVIGTIIAAAGAKSKYKNVVQIFFTMGIIFLCVGMRFFIEGIFRDDKVEQTLNQLSDITNNIKTVYIPAKIFENAVVKFSFVDILIFILSSIVVFEFAFTIISHFYRRINSRLMTTSASRKFEMKNQKSHGVVNSIAFKELKRFTGSVNYFVNAGMGQIILLVISVVVLFLDMDKILYVITNGAPVSKQMLLPAVPMVVYWLLSMMATTAVSVSLEGKNYWIIQSLPVEKKDFCNGKMLFNLWITVPFSVLGNLSLGFACGGSLLEVLLCVITGIIQCCFCTVWGMVCGLNFLKLDWQNEMEVIKQGTGTVVYLLPNMFISMGLTVLCVVLGLKFSFSAIVLITAAVYLLGAIVSYIVVMKKAENL